MLKRTQKILWPFLTASGSMSLAVSCYVIFIWAWYQGAIEAAGPEDHQWFGPDNLGKIIFGAFVMHIAAIGALLSFGQYRWYRVRWEHYALTGFAIIIIMVDLIIYGVIRLVM